MPGAPPKQVTVHVDPDVAKRADEAYEAEIDAEVDRRIAQEKSTHMDAAQLAALNAAEKKAGDALARADASDKALKEAQDKAAAADKRAGDALAAVEALRTDLKTRGDAERTVTETETLRRARLIAEARGRKGDALEAEAKRLAGFGRDAVDELLRATPAPSADPLALQLGGSTSRGDQATGPVSTSLTPDGRKAFTVSDAKLTVPNLKVA